MVRVFLASQDPRLSESLRNAFEAEGNFEVCGSATNRLEAVSKALEVSPDLVILDWDLPPKDGFETAEEIKAAVPKVSVFMVAEHPAMETEKEAFAHGIDAMFEKDHDYNSMVANARATCDLR